MANWHETSDQVVTPGCIDQFCLESRATARELRCLLRLHECGPRAELLLQRMEKITGQLAQAGVSVISERLSREPTRGKDRWLGIS